LIVAGRFADHNGTTFPYLAGWNGQDWHSLGIGVDGQVSDLLVHNGQLIAGGQFLNAGGVRVNYIAAWDGATWSSLGGGTGGRVSAMCIHNGDLIVDGNFASPLQWDGQTWIPLGHMTCCANAMISYGGTIIASVPYPASTRLRRFDGNLWLPLGDP